MASRLDLSKVEGARKLLSDAGISVHIVKMQPSGMGSDEEVDYAFKVAKAMGAKAVTDEINLGDGEKSRSICREAWDVYGFP